ncbi:MAG: malate synthase G [Halieaceae bacterium]|nr:malate synthase G [Halieaceae bacterium]
MPDRTTKYDLQIKSTLLTFLENEVLPGTQIEADDFWFSLREIIVDLSPINRQLLDERTKLQKEINQWHLKNPGPIRDFSKYEKFLLDIGYLIPEGPDFKVETANVDPEISQISAPQLVVPITNARYSINATNARWGSLYDALYGTDVIPEKNGAEQSDSYNPTRGKLVIEWVRNFLDRYFPLQSSSHKLAQKYELKAGALKITLQNGKITRLRYPDQLKGYVGDEHTPTSILLMNNCLYVELQIDRNDPVGADDLAGIKDVILESAITTIQDCEDSVSCVDAEDKILAYRNWLGLMKGTLEESFTKGGKELRRKLNPNRVYSTPEGNELVLSGRSVLFIRNVGHLMTSDAILDSKGHEIPEGIMDAIFTALISIHDLKRPKEVRNSQSGSIYIVKPKMHGPEEVAFTCELFSRVETALKLPKHALKLGIMDEERRTTINLKECIRHAKKRIVFINTGFLDRTGDEIHTSIRAGSVLAKNSIKSTDWMNAYEDWNVDIGLACGLNGRAQIGKGMWAAPDLMKDMLEEKISHPRSGASTSWVPSPTAATLHATHYHEVNVAKEQEKIATRPNASLKTILTPSVYDDLGLTEDQIQKELDNNIQGILGYVVRWINHGIGCSKVPDINNVGLMEDRATLRISSQHICNWLLHNDCSNDQILKTLEKMAQIVDKQNSLDSDYSAMSSDLDKSIAFQAAKDLIFHGLESPNGYTEPILHKRRNEFKKSLR